MRYRASFLFCQNGLIPNSAFFCGFFFFPPPINMVDGRTAFDGQMSVDGRVAVDGQTAVDGLTVDGRTDR